MSELENKNETPIAASEASEKKDLTDALAEVTAATPKEKEKKQRITFKDDELIMIDQREYRLATNYRDAFDIEKINERYSDVLNRYDYIVGDIGFEQLRLKGFFSENQKKMPVEHRIGSLQDYLYEYCNFGCAYFVLERVGRGPINEKRPARNNRSNRRNRPVNPGKQVAHVQEKKGPTPAKQGNSNKTKPVIKNRREAAKTDAPKQAPGQSESGVKKGETGKRNFTIRQKSE